MVEITDHTRACYPEYNCTGCGTPTDVEAYYAAYAREWYGVLLVADCPDCPDFDTHWVFAHEDDTAFDGAHDLWEAADLFDKQYEYYIDLLHPDQIEVHY